MKTKTIKSLLLSAVGAVTFSSIAIGTTFALFTSSAETAIEVASGKINVQQQVSITSKTSALYDPNGTYDVDRNGNHYSSQDGWVNGGDAEVLSDGSLSLTKMTPGDKVNFKVQMKNNSNVACKYRFVFEAVDKSSLLASGLEVSINDVVYAGLLSYSTEWTLISPVETPEFGDLITGSIYLPMTRDNVFQNLNTSYALRIEAIQSNAYTTGDASYEVASYLPQSAVLDAEKKASVVYDEGQDSEVAIDLDLSNSTTYQVGQEVILSVNNVDVVENASSFVVSQGNSAAAAIDLNLYINEEKVTDGFVAKIATKVATGLDEESIKVEYDSDQDVAFADGGHKVDSIEAVDEVGEFYYNPANGDLVFMTDHFSDYIVSANNINAYNKTAKMSYISFDDAVKGAKTGDVITLLKDVDISDLIPTNGRYFINDVNLDELTIDGLGHKITVSNRGFGIQIEKTTFRNVDIVNATSGGRCIDTRADSTHPVNELNLENVNLQTTTEGAYDQPLTIGGNSATALKLNISNSKIAAKQYYAVTVFNPIDCKINNSIIEGWACLYLQAPSSSAGSAGSTIEINNSIFNSVNKYSGSSNAFAAINCDDMNGKVDIDVNSSVFNITAEGDQYQAVIRGTSSAVQQGLEMFDLNIQNSTIYLNGENAIPVFNLAGTIDCDENTQIIQQ